ncbi:MAG: hypothetical protein J6A60_05285, partial [Clostridia bacterium]|nr:hypothetical protein [Clostridia bacterium]
MKGKIEDTLLAVVSLILAFSVLFSVSAYAEQSISVDNLSNKSYNENEETKNIAELSLNSVKPEAKWDYVKVKFPFILVPLHSEPVPLIYNTGFLWIGTEVEVLGYHDDFTYVEVRKTRERGYVLGAFLDDETRGEPKISLKSTRVWVGQEIEIKVNNTGADKVKWHVSNPEVASFTKTANGIRLQALKSGVVTVTASNTSLTKSFQIACVNKWEEHEYSRTEKSVEVKKFPFDSSDSIQTLEKGSLVEAIGDMGINSGWIFINTENGIRGFIKLSEFPGIDYIMHQYHYYDFGYELRFGSPRDRIFDYAAVMNRHMLRMFNLKVCPYVNSYTSIADECKIAQFGNIKEETLANACPKNEGHKPTSCLHIDTVFGDLKKQYGEGDRLCPKTGWTGHVLLGNARSAS